MEFFFLLSFVLLDTVDLNKETRWMEIFFLLSFVLLDAVDHPGQLLSDGRPRQSESFTRILSMHPNDDDDIVACK